MPEFDATPPRVLVADDDPLVRASVCDGLRAGGFAVVAAAGDGREAVELAVHYRPELVVTDIVMPLLDGVMVTRELRTRGLDNPILLIAGSADAELAVAGLHAGADGFVHKRAGVEQIVSAATRVLAGETVVDGEVVGALLQSFRRQPAAGIGLRPVASPLTDREWEVLDALCVGLGTEQIAGAFVVSVDTIRSHLKSVYRKLGVHSAEEAVATAPGLRRPSPAVVTDG